MTKKLKKIENGIFGISVSRGFRKVIICHIFGEKIDQFKCSKKFWRLDQGSLSLSQAQQGRVRSFVDSFWL